MTPEQLAILEDINCEAESAYDAASAAINQCIEARKRLLESWSKLNSFTMLMQTFAKVREEMKGTK